MEGCWINPEGKIFEVRSCRHLEFATYYLKENMSWDEYEESRRDLYETPSETLMKRGWVRVEINPYEPRVQILGNCIDMTRPMRNTMDPPMNVIQMRVAKAICAEYGITLHKAINDKMWW